MASRQVRLCPHCECSVSKKAYATYKRLYYNNDTNKWIKKRRLIPDEHLSLLTETELGMEECDYAFDTCNENLSDTDHHLRAHHQCLTLILYQVRPQSRVKWN